MNRLLLLAILLPAFAFGQKFELSEQAGYSTTSTLTNNRLSTHGFSNHMSASYYLFRRLSVSAFYEFNGWKTDCNTFGIAPDFVSKYFYAGMDMEMAKYKSLNNFPDFYSYKKSWGYGLHIGSKQRIYKRLSVVEQLGYDRHVVSVSDVTNTGGVPITSESKYMEPLDIWYLRAGLSYAIK